MGRLALVVAICFIGWAGARAEEAPAARALRFRKSVLSFTVNENEPLEESLAGEKYLDNPGTETPIFLCEDAAAWVHLSAEGELELTPSGREVGVHRFKLQATSGEDTAETELRIEVLRNKRVPVWKGNPLPAAIVGKAYDVSLENFVSDPDGDYLIYKKLAGPAWLKLDEEGNLTGTPAVGDIGTRELKVRVVNAVALTAENAFRLVVKQANHPPVWKEPRLTLPPVTAGEAFAFAFAAEASDADGDALTFTVKKSPAWLARSGGKLAGTPKESDVGPFRFEIEVGDGEAKALLHAEGTVSHKGQAPSLKAQALSFSVREKQLLSEVLNQKRFLDGAPDHAAVTYALSPSVPWVTLSRDGKLVAKPGHAEVGSHVFELTATAGQLSAVAELKIEVEREPVAPGWEKAAFVFKAPARETFTADLAPLVTSPDGALVTFTKKSGPAWLTVSPSGQIGGIPEDRDQGRNRFVIQTVGEGPPSTAEVLVEVAFKNHPPRIDESRLRFIVKERETFQVSLGQAPFIEDADRKDKLRFQATGEKLDWVTLSESGQLTIKAGFREIGDHAFPFQVSDGTETVPGALSITIERSPRAPLWRQKELVYRLSARRPFEISLKDQAKDADGLPLVFEKKSGPRWLKLSPDGLVSANPPNEDAGKVEAAFAVKNDVLGAEIPVHLTVLADHPPPLFLRKEIALPKGKVGEPYRYDLGHLAVGSDPEHLLKYSFVSAPGWLKINPDATLESREKPRERGQYTLTVRATDSFGQSAEAKLTLEIAGKNMAPHTEHATFSIPPAKSGELMMFDVKTVVRDPDGDKLTFRKVDGPEWISVAKTGEITGVTSVAKDLDYQVKVEASDGTLTTSVIGKGKILPAPKRGVAGKK